MKFISGHLKMALLFGVLAVASMVVWSGMQQQETTIEIRASRQGDSIPDGFMSGTILTPMALVLKALRLKTITY